MFSKRNKGSSVFSLNHEQYLTLAEANEKKQNRIRATHIHAQHAYFVLLTCTPNVDEECVAVVFYSRKVTRLLELVSAHMWQLVVAATTIRLINMVFSHEFHFVYIYVHPFQLARTILRLLPLLFFSLCLSLFSAFCFPFASNHFFVFYQICLEFYHRYSAAHNLLPIFYVVCLRVCRQLLPFPISTQKCWICIKRTHSQCDTVNELIYKFDYFTIAALFLKLLHC